MKEWKRLALLTKKKKYKHEKDKTSKRFKKKYGFDYRETWNLDYEIACFILPRLVYLKDHCGGYPYNLARVASDGFTIIESGHEEWKKILNKMIKAFEIVVKNEATLITGEEKRVVEEGLDLFREYYFSLWD